MAIRTAPSARGRSPPAHRHRADACRPARRAAAARGGRSISPGSCAGKAQRLRGRHAAPPVLRGTRPGPSRPAALATKRPSLSPGDAAGCVRRRHPRWWQRRRCGRRPDRRPPRPTPQRQAQPGERTETSGRDDGRQAAARAPVLLFQWIAQILGRHRALTSANDASARRDSRRDITRADATGIHAHRRPRPGTDARNAPTTQKAGPTAAPSASGWWTAADLVRDALLGASPGRQRSPACRAAGRGVVELRVELRIVRHVGGQRACRLLALTFGALRRHVGGSRGGVIAAGGVASSSACSPSPSRWPRSSDSLSVVISSHVVRAHPAGPRCPARCRAPGSSAPTACSSAPS